MLDFFLGLGEDRGYNGISVRPKKMGGGVGAKERRRLKRLAHDGVVGHDVNEMNDVRGGGGGSGLKGTNVDVSSSSMFQPERKRIKSKTTTMEDRANGSKTYHYAKSSIGRFTQQHMVNTKTTKSQSKQKKPKHLKRKLEQVSDDKDEREKVLRRLEDWNKTKEEFAKKAAKREKLSNVSSQQGMKPRMSSVAVLETRRNVSDGIAQEDVPVFKSLKDNNRIRRSKEKEANANDPLATNESNKRNDAEKTITVKEVSTNAILKSDDHKTSSDDDDDDVDVDTTRRQRGRRRRGRKDTSKKIEETLRDGSEINVETNELPQESVQKEVTNVKSSKADDIAVKKEESEESRTSKRRDLKKDDNRYCIGRKPVTDFAIGQKYQGKVVYVKPFGVFFDIGCHSDAFCHVSRLRDDFVEDPLKEFKEGNSVSVRVVEIDRRQKRITVSLQSDSRIDDERASIEARLKRKESHQTKNGKKKKAEVSAVASPAPANPTEKKPIKETLDAPAQNSKSRVGGDGTKHSVLPVAESKMAHSELKRARKLARRAARRENTNVGEDEPSQ